MQRRHSRRVQRASLDDVASGALCAAEENAIASYAKVARYGGGNVRENGTSGRGSILFEIIRRTKLERESDDDGGPNGACS